MFFEQTFATFAKSKKSPPTQKKTKKKKLTRNLEVALHRFSSLAIFSKINVGI
jgi:hypothetical protein